jgi:hypothetical protein
MSKTKHTLLRWVLIPFLLFVWASPAWAVLYKWKDEKGQHYTDDITKVPPEHRPAYTKKKPRPKKKTEKPKTSESKISNKNSSAQNYVKGQNKQQLPPNMDPQEMERMAEELMRGLEQSMEQLAEEMGGAFEEMEEEYQE